VTKSINNIVDHAFSAKDPFFFFFWGKNFRLLMHGSVTEQREEETMSRRALEVFEKIMRGRHWTFGRSIRNLETSCLAAAAAEG